MTNGESYLQEAVNGLNKYKSIYTTYEIKFLEKIKNYDKNQLKKMTNLNFKKVNVSNAGLARLLIDKQRLIKAAQEFLNQFTEDETGYMSDETYLLCEKLGVNERVINFLSQLLIRENNEFNKAITVEGLEGLLAVEKNLNK